MIKSLIARLSATLVLVFLVGLFPKHNLHAQNSISGTICSDTDLDNVAELASGQDDEFVGVTVSLEDCTGAIVAATVTDANGEYEFDVPNSCYNLVLNMPVGYCVVPGGAVNADGIVIIGNVVDTDFTIDACLTKNAGIAGHAWGDENGDGIFDGEAGEGLVVVTLTGSDPFYGSTNISKLTNNDGSYNFLDLCPGNYDISFTVPSNHFVTFSGLGTDPDLDSDIDPLSVGGVEFGVESLTLTPGTFDPGVNAGFVECDLNFIDGQLAFCNTDEAFSEIYAIETHGTLGDYNWSVVPHVNFPTSPGASINNPTMANGNVVQLDFLPGAGSYTVTFEYRLNAADINAVCTRSFDIHIVDEPSSNVIACNNIVNLSLDANCMVEVTPDILLEGNAAAEGGYTVELTDVQGDSILPSNMAGVEYAGRTLVGKVTHVCSGNSCWGNISIEDKNIPELECRDVTVSCGQDIDPILPGVSTFNFSEAITTDQSNVFNSLVNWPVTGSGTATCYAIDASSLCGSSILCFQDSLGAVDCTDPNVGQVIFREWTVTTPSGSMDKCTEEISFTKPDLSMLDFPDNFVGEDALDCRFAVSSLDSIKGPNYWLVLPDGNPDPNTPNHALNPVGLESSCERLKASFTDQRYGDCDGSYKLQRTWVVLDWCTSEVRDEVQIIEVAQRGSIVCVAPPELEVPAGIGCSNAFDVPPPTIVFPGCSPITSIKVGYKVADDLGGCEGRTFTFAGVTENADGSFRIPNVDRPSNMIWISYVIENECGQTCTACTEAVFVDSEEPYAVCDQETIVSINEDGEAWAIPESFDDGSWDNCGLSHLEVMKIGGSDCGVTREFARKIKFCCEDVGQKVEVHVKAIDNAGFENTCKSWVEVQDNFAPILISCPPDMTADCNIDPMNLSGFGAPEFDGVCDVSIVADTTININDCGVGSITRVWTGVNSKGGEQVCRQIISVGRNNPFDEDDITWPQNFEGTGCFGDINLDPRDLPANAGLPIINEVICSNISFDYEDVVLRSDESCIKIVREWTVLDLCQYNSNSNTGRFTFTQVIQIDDTTEPVITSGCSNLLVDGPGLNNNCTIDLNLSATATDDCTQGTELRWSYIVRETDSGIQNSGEGNDASGTYGIGNYNITWTVRDNCDNETSCSQTITIEDTRAPTPFCLGDITTVLNQGTMSVSVSAIDFISHAADNCGPDGGSVDVAFSEDRSDTSLTVDCSDFTSDQYEESVRIYAIDEAGNFTFCEARLVVQDNHGL